MHKRYEAEPLRNAKANALCKRIVQLCGEDDAPRIARWYVERETLPEFIRCRHSLDFLVSRFNAVHINFSRGKAVSTAEITQPDREESAMEIVNQTVEKMDKRYGAQQSVFPALPGQKQQTLEAMF
jgi:hypothetical protein